MSVRNDTQSNLNLFQQMTGCAHKMFIERPVQWIKEPGENATMRKTVAATATLLLAWTLIGFPLTLIGASVAFLVHREWHKVEAPSAATPVVQRAITAS